MPGETTIPGVTRRSSLVVVFVAGKSTENLIALQHIRQRIPCRLLI
jgi:hypothetical protein